MRSRTITRQVGRKCEIQNAKSEQPSEVHPDDHIRATEQWKNCQKQLQGQVRTMLAALQDRTQHRPTTDSALMKWFVRHAAWLIPRFR